MRAADVPSGVVVVGVGFRPGTGADRIVAAVRAVLGTGDCRCLATLDRRAGEPGLREAATRLGLPVRAFPPAELAEVEVPHPCARAAAATGTASVAEAAAILAAGGGPLVRAKSVHDGVTVALARPAT